MILILRSIFLLFQRKGSHFDFEWPMKRSVRVRSCFLIDKYNIYIRCIHTMLIWRKDWLYASEQVGSNKTEYSPLNRVFITVLFYPRFSRSFLVSVTFHSVDRTRSMFQVEHCQHLFTHIYIYTASEKITKKKNLCVLTRKKFYKILFFTFFFIVFRVSRA